jgi:hypothetical protein
LLYFQFHEDQTQLLYDLKKEFLEGMGPSH